MGRNPCNLPRPCRTDAMAASRLFDKECVIVCALPRGRRGNDGKVYRVTPPWEGPSKHFTQEFEAFAQTLMREMPVRRAGQILGESTRRCG